MKHDNSSSSHSTFNVKIFKVIYYFCAVYFLLMGAGLIFFPKFLVRGITNSEVNPTIIGMLRGAGGATIPYALLYIMIAQKPFQRFWGIYTILAANTVAIILDLWSVYLQEYQWSYAMYDIPVELLSIFGIFILWRSRKEIKQLV